MRSSNSQTITRAQILLDSKHTSSSKSYFYYKNFQVVKRNNIRVRLSGASGCLSEVFLAISKIDRKEYALKIIEKPKVDIEKARRDLNLHLALKHPNIICLHSYSETNQRFFLIMEKASKSIKSEMKQLKSRLSNQTCKQYIKDTLNAVKYLHSLGISGLEINLNHMLISDDSVIKLCCIRHSDEIKQINYDLIMNDIRAIGLVLHLFVTGHELFDVSRTF